MAQAVTDHEVRHQRAEAERERSEDQPADEADDGSDDDGMDTIVRRGAFITDVHTPVFHRFQWR